MRHDIKSVAAAAASRGLELLREWFPNGRAVGKEFKLGGLDGHAGKKGGGSLGINTTTFEWQDFDTGEKGGDLVSLYAASRRINNGEAAQIIGERLGLSPDARATMPAVAARKPEPPLELTDAEPDPATLRYRGHAPSRVWYYRSADGRIAGADARYDPPGEKKSVMPWRVVDGRWVMKAMPEPRPLYVVGSGPAVIVEGCKCADAIAEAGFTGVSWQGGSNADGKADWRGIGPGVTIWPDADKPGRACAERIAGMIPSPLMVTIPDGVPDGWDCADAQVDQRRAIVRAAKPWNPPAPEPEPMPDDLLPDEYNEPELPTISMVQVAESLKLTKTKAGGIIGNVSNAIKCLTGFHDLLHIDGKPRMLYDEQRNRIIRADNGDNWTDDDTTAIQVLLQEKCGMFTVGLDTVTQAVSYVAVKHKRNDLKDWLLSLRWDGVERLPTMMAECWGTDRTEYYAALGKNFLLGAVKRALRPGVQFDNMVVFEGKQGTFKSTALRVLFGEWHAETSIRMDKSDFILILHSGPLCVEISELAGLKGSRKEVMKQMITCIEDRHTFKYAKMPKLLPRRCILTATTNDKNYLEDETGNRRFWPVECGAIDIELIAANRDQFFAEAVARAARGEAHHIMPIEETLAIQAAREPERPIMDVIEKWLDENPHRPHPTTAEIILEALRMDPSRLTDRLTRDEVRISMRKLGWTDAPVWFSGEKKSGRAWTRG